MSTAWGSWPPPNPSSGGGGAAAGLETTGEPVDVSGAAPPVAGQVLTATGPDAAEWRVPGLRYDAGVRFNLGVGGTASIEPGTWGLANELPVGATEGTIAIVSSLSAPPVDSRFAVYVARAVTATIRVTVVGAASIQALNGALSSSVVVPTGVYVEWILYHDPVLGAVWGLVSDTGRQWLQYNGVPTTDPVDGQWQLAADATTTFLPTATAIGQHVGVYVAIGNYSAEFRCAGSIVQMDRTLYPANTQIPTRPGAWYEWVSLDIGGALRWVPVGGSGTSAAPPLRFASLANTADVVNHWVLGSEHPTFELPGQLEHGDTIAIYADAACQVRPAQSTFLQKPDLTAVVAWPTYISLVAGIYYEWIYTAADHTWRPRQNMLDGGGSASRPPVPYARPPATPNAFNFEARTATSADLAANGFTFRRGTATAGTMVRVGEIDKYRARGASTAALTALQYRSSLINGVLYIQLPAINNVSYSITKTVSVPSTTTSHGAIVWGKVTAAANFNGSGHSFLHQVGFYKSSGGFANEGDCLGTGYYTTNHLQQRMSFWGGSVVDNDLGLPGLDQRDVKIVTAQATSPNMTWFAEQVSSGSNNHHAYGDGVAGGLVSTIGHAGVNFDGGTNFTAIADKVPWHYSIEYLRLYTGDLTNVWVANL